MVNYEEISMEIIVNSGIAKSKAIEAIRLTKMRKFQEIDKLLDDAKQHLILASKNHFEIIQKEAAGENIEFKLLLMHAEDQLLATQTTIDIAEAIIDLFRI